MDMLKIFYATKHVSWKHEAEFRLVSKTGDIALNVSGRFTEVILGEKVSDTDAQSVLAAIKGRAGTKLTSGCNGRPAVDPASSLQRWACPEHASAYLRWSHSPT